MLDIRLAKSAEDKEACFRLRYKVFVEEQGVPPEMEIDGYDESDATHFLGHDEGLLVATARFIIAGDAAKIGRVAVDAASRGKGFGADIMRAIKHHVAQRQLAERLILDSQASAIAFYERLGFAVEGETFDDAGIPHVRMTRRARL